MAMILNIIIAAAICISAIAFYYIFFYWLPKQTEKDWIPNAANIRGNIRRKTIKDIKKRLWETDRIPVIFDSYNVDWYISDELDKLGFTIEQDEKIGFRYHINYKETTK